MRNQRKIELNGLENGQFAGPFKGKMRMERQLKMVYIRLTAKKLDIPGKPSKAQGARLSGNSKK